MEDQQNHIGLVIDSLVIGLDLSLTSTGVATKSETFTIKPKMKGMQRLDFIRSEIQCVLESIDNPVVMVEGYAMAKHTSHAHAQGELGGIIRLMLYQNGIPYIEVPPTNRAKFATGRGNAGKSEVISQVSVKTGIVWSGTGADDECDAWVLREMLIAKYGCSKFSWGAKSMEALDKIDWSPLTSHSVLGRIEQ